MHYPMFSHAPEPVDQQHQHNGEERTVALYVESTLEPHENLGGTAEYIHLLVAQAAPTERGKPYRPLH